jgi:hypothetical protein
MALGSVPQSSSQLDVHRGWSEPERCLSVGPTFGKENNLGQCCSIESTISLSKLLLSFPQACPVLLSVGALTFREAAAAATYYYGSVRCLRAALS